MTILKRLFISENLRKTKANNLQQAEKIRDLPINRVTRSLLILSKCEINRSHFGIIDVSDLLCIYMYTIMSSLCIIRHIQCSSEV